LTFFWSFPLKKNFVIVVGWVARFFLVQTYQNGKNISNDHKLHIPNGHKLYQMAIKYSKWSLPFKGSPKFTQICHFWCENKPSGNLGRRDEQQDRRINRLILTRGKLDGIKPG
jgi:hypothetical protein